MNEIEPVKFDISCTGVFCHGHSNGSLTIRYSLKLQGARVLTPWHGGNRGRNCGLGFLEIFFFGSLSRLSSVSPLIYGLVGNCWKEIGSVAYLPHLSQYVERPGLPS